MLYWVGGVRELFCVGGVMIVVFGCIEVGRPMIRFGRLHVSCRTIYALRI